MSDVPARMTISMSSEVANRLRFYQLAMGVSLSSIVEVACKNLIATLPPMDDVAEIAQTSAVAYRGAARGAEAAYERISTLKQGALALK